MSIFFEFVNCGFNGIIEYYAFGVWGCLIGLISCINGILAWIFQSICFFQIHKWSTVISIVTSIAAGSMSVYYEELFYDELDLYLQENVNCEEELYFFGLLWGMEIVILYCK